MKIQQQHFEVLHACMLATRKIQRIDQALTQMELSEQYSNERIRWDWFHVTKIEGETSGSWANRVLYPYLNDRHIDTALKRITRLT